MILEQIKLEQELDEITRMIKSEEEQKKVDEQIEKKKIEIKYL